MSTSVTAAPQPATAMADYGPDEAAMQAYLREGESRAREIGNRGPIRFDARGKLHSDILDAYRHCGFYVFKGVLGQEELDDLEADLFDILDRLPVEQSAPVGARGLPALAVGCEAPTLFWSRPLGDPFGGADLANGRRPVKMTEPVPPAGVPKEVVYLILGSLQFSEACLRTYGHPDLLAVAAAINGEDFVPFTEALFIKEPARGASVAWHQDGVTHWDRPAWDQGSHGFNFMAQLYGCTPANGVWLVPGAHRLGKVDIKAMVAEAGTERLPDAVPMICAPGDVAICNRQVLHGSFANTSDRWRGPSTSGSAGAPRCSGCGAAGSTSARGVRRGADPPALPDDWIRHRRAPPALPRRDAVRLPAVRRVGRDLPVERGGQSRPQGLQPARPRHLTAFGVYPEDAPPAGDVRTAAGIRRATSPPI